MIYNAEDKWNKDAPHLEHANHKYYMKIGQGPNARYFYSAQEYAAYQRGARKPSSMLNNLKSAFANSNPRAVAAQRAKNQGEQQMAEVRKRRAEALNKIETNKRMIAYNKTSKLNAQAGKEQRAKSVERVKQQANRRRAAREQAFKEIGEARKTEGARRAVAAQRNETSRKMADAAKKRSAERTKRDAAYNKKSNKPIISRESYVNGKRVSKETVLGTKDIKRAARKVGYRAKDAYNKVKKAVTSSTAKKYKKKAKRTAQSAYKRGSNFVKKLLGR